MQEKTPECIGIILDGNRRWAKENNLPKLEGHRRGYERAIECARWVRDRGIKHLAVFAFSTENWNRETVEVTYLMKLFERMALKEGSLPRLAKEGVRIRFIGKFEMLPDSTRRAISAVEKQSAENKDLTLWVCLSYGGRAEIVAAANSAVEAGEELTEQTLRRHFWSADMPDPDIVVRTGGVFRLSNFLLWQTAYSELFFIDTLWPEFSEKMLDEILEEYNKRERRMGK